MARKFIPENAGMTKDEIDEWLQDEIENNEWEYSYKKSLLKNDHCQEFVNTMHDLQEDHLDSREEDLVEARKEYMRDLLERICGE